MTVKERLEDFLAYKGLKPSHFEKTCGISNGYVKNMRNSIGPDVLPKILKAYPDLNKVWLLHGEGKMLLGGDDLVTVRKNENKDLELIELRAITEVLIDYVLQLRAQSKGARLTEVVDEYDQDLTLQLRKLKK